MVKLISSLCCFISLGLSFHPVFSSTPQYIPIPVNSSFSILVFNYSVAIASWDTLIIILYYHLILSCPLYSPSYPPFYVHCFSSTILPSWSSQQTFTLPTLHLFHQQCSAGHTPFLYLSSPTCSLSNQLLFSSQKENSYNVFAYFIDTSTKKPLPLLYTLRCNNRIKMYYFITFISTLCTLSYVITPSLFSITICFFNLLRIFPLHCHRLLFLLSL